MSKGFKRFGFTISAAVLLIGMLAAGSAFAWGKIAKPTASAAAAPTAGFVKAHGGKALLATDSHIVDPSKIAGGLVAYSGPVKMAPTTPYTTKLRMQQAAKAHATARLNAPKADASAGTPSTSPQTPFRAKQFTGLANTCNPSLNNGFSFQPADLAVATSSSWVVEAVNDCIAVYNTSGALQSGWPKAPSAFFGVPNLGICQALHDGHPFMSDPRAAYDPATGKFILQWLEAEGVFGIDSCPVTSRVWQAVSNTSDPRGAWTVHSFSVADTFNNTTSTAGDFDTLGFDPQGIYFSVNEFDLAGSSFFDSFFCGVPWSNLGTAACFHQASLTGSRTIFADTMQPVINLVPGYGPRAEYFVNTYNIEGDPFTSDCFSTSCNGVDVWAFSNLQNWALGGSFPHLSEHTIGNTHSYIAPPAGDDPAGASTVETSDTRISSTALYSAGTIWAAWGTGVTNYQGHFVPGVDWTQSRAELTDNNAGACPAAGDICPDLGTSFQQMGYYFFEPNTQGAYFPTIMTDAESNLFMAFDSSSTSLNRAAWYVSRRTTSRAGVFHDYGRSAQSGAASNTEFRWGDYSAASYDGLANDHPWLCAQYTRVADDWGTTCVQVNYTLTYP